MPGVAGRFPGELLDRPHISSRLPSSSICSQQLVCWQVERVVLLKQIIIKAAATGTDVQIIIKDDDTATVTSGGSTVNLPNSPYPSQAEWSLSFGSPTILTLHRYRTEYKQGYVYRWSVDFVFGEAPDARHPA